MQTEIHNQAIWIRLAAVTTLRFESRSAKSDQGWNGAGSGIVRVELADTTSLVFHEKGQWTPTGTEAAIQFTNVFRWTSLQTDRIRIEHLRFGPDRPVLLFDLQKTAMDQWQSVEPHVCRDDLYSAVLDVGAEDLVSQWKVTGPEKEESIRYWVSARKTTFDPNSNVSIT